MGMLWVVLFVALTGSQLGLGSPVRSTPQVYPHDTSGPAFEGWSSEGGLYAAIPALALVFAAVGLLFGCTWCYRHKDCKPNEGADNQLFTASATHLHDARRSQPPDSGFSEPINNNISEDNNNGPISLREMQNIANNNAAAYIISENEERNRVSRESVVEFEPLPSEIRVADPLEHCADWFGGEDFQRNRLQYLREIGRGWFGRVVEGEIESECGSTVAVKILNQNASLEDKARFLDEARVYRDVQHDNILAFVAKCLDEDPWILMFELCSMDLHQYLQGNRAQMAALNESGAPLQLMCDVASALAYLHSHGYLYGNLTTGNVLVRGATESPRAVLGSYAASEPRHEFTAPETRRHPPVHTAGSEVWALGTLVWEVCSWGAAPPAPPAPPPPPALPCLYRNHLYQVMQLCWDPNPDQRPSSQQVHALLNHLHATHARAESPLDGQATTDLEERWQRLKPNSIPKIDEHVAIVHAPSTSMASHFTGSEEFHPQDTLSIDMDTAVSRSSSIMSDKDPLSVQIKSESLTNLHGSLEDVRNIYLTHNETAVLECHQGNISLEDSREKEQDHSDSSVDPWVKDIMAGSQDDVSYYKDVSDVIKNLDNILNSEKTSSSESSHQASPSRDNLSLDCKKEHPLQSSSLVKSPGISNFQNILAMGFDAKESCDDDEVDRETIGTLSHSFERHSDTISQQTLENLTPDTPIKDIDIFCKESLPERLLNDITDDKDQDTELPKDVECSDSLPKQKELCVASLSSVSENEQLNLREDCETSCDNNLAEIVRTDTEVKTKSIDNIIEKAEDMLKKEPEPVEEITETLVEKTEEPETLNRVDNVMEMNSVENILPKTENEIVTNNTLSEIVCDDLESLAETAHEELIEAETGPLDEAVSLQSNKSPINDILPDLISLITDSSNKEVNTTENVPENAESETVEIIESLEKIEEELPLSPTRSPESVQKNYSESEALKTETEKAETKSNNLRSEIKTEPELPPEIVQNTTKEELPTVSTENDNKDELTNKLPEVIKEDTSKSDDSIQSDEIKEQTNNSTVYMDLINNTNSEIKINSEILEDNTLDNNMINIIQSCLDNTSNETECSLVKNESTVYLDLPSVLKETDTFLHSERIVSSQNMEPKEIGASTPKGSEGSANNTLECSGKGIETDLSETKVPDCGSVSQTKFEVPESISPFESPSKSHHTDTYDENSSVVLGPFENCNVELFKGNKSEVDLPKEELLAFSSNFSEINLETPSPLRDGNFLNEVPDIVSDDLQFDDVTISESKPERTSDTDETDPSGTAKRVSPSTPPNSPGIFLASTSQQKYLVDIDLDPPETTSYPPIESDSGLSSLQKEIDLNQIELQITSKLAMAENENNLNIEYSGPLTVEGLVSEEEVILRDSEALPESFLAGNGGSAEDLRGLTLDEECVAALRNELELKLPLAQVASIEPPCEETEWAELPPPPELVVSYCGGALSPIAEETRHQLSAYELDWNTSTRTDSSESYPEPCNNSTDEVTDLPTGGHDPDHDNDNDHSTYTVQSRHSHDDTYTLQKDVPSSKEMTMTADSLNGSPYKKPANDQSPIDDRTYNKNEEEKESNCERISQESPFLMSPTTDSAPVDSDNLDNATGISTLSKTTDAKLSKPSECLSKATSIDSWCSNDTLYNVEENFDDLAMDPDVVDFEPEKEDKSESTDTLTHNEDEKELSHCSTYIVHDSKSEASETFSPDSITANDNYTYTKVKTEAVTPSVTTKSEVNDSTKSQTKDLAYGTLPSYSNCTTDLLSEIDDPWKLPQPELVRRSPFNDDTFTPPKLPEVKEIFNESPLTSDPCIKKMDSVDISCLHDDLIDSENKSGDKDATRFLVDIDSENKSGNNDASRLLVDLDIDSENKSGNNDASRLLVDLDIDSENKSGNNDASRLLVDLDIDSENKSGNNDASRLLVDLDIDSENKSGSNDATGLLVDLDVSPKYNYRDMAPSITSTPLTEPVEDDCEPIPMTLPDSKSSEYLQNIPNFQTFIESAEIRPQDLSSNTSNALVSTNQDTDLLLEGESKTLSSRDSVIVSERTPTYSDFENSAFSKPQEVSLRNKSSQSLESGMSSVEFGQFENSVRVRPQDLSPINDVNSLLLHNERKATDLVTYSDDTRQSSTTIDPVLINPPKIQESQIDRTVNILVTDYDEEETDQPHSIIITEANVIKESPNRSFASHNSDQKTPDVNVSKESKSPNMTFDSHTNQIADMYQTYDSHAGSSQPGDVKENGETPENPTVNGIDEHELVLEGMSPKEDKSPNEDKSSKEGGTTLESKVVTTQYHKDIPNGSVPHDLIKHEIKCNGNSQNYATVNFLNETFEELMESNVDEENKDIAKDLTSQHDKPIELIDSQNKTLTKDVKRQETSQVEGNGTEDPMTAVTDIFLQKEKQFCQLDCYLPMLSDIRFTGPAEEIMSTSFTQDSPTEPNSPECEQDSKPNAAADIMKEWDSDSDSHSSNSSSGEFIWKDGDGHETAVVPSTHFDHQRGSQPNGSERGRADGAASEGSGDSGSGSGSEGDEVEFVPSSWDCRAEPSKSSLRSLEQAPPDGKKRVVFKRQKYHCVYEYPREAADADAQSPAAYLPDLSTYCEWDPTSAEEAELGYGQLFGAPNPLDMYPLRAGMAFGADYDEDFFISSSARPFESLGIMSTTSQFFPGMHVKPLLERELDEPEDFPAPPSPLHTPTPTPTPTATVPNTRTLSLDFTTPDSGVEDITPGSTSTDEDFKSKKLGSSLQCWKPVDSASSSESVSPSSPGGEALGGLRHTRDKLKLDLPPSPHIPSPRHNRVFNFVLDKPKRHRVPDERPAEISSTPLIMTDETPIITTSLPLQKDSEDVTVPEPTFSTFGKCIPKNADSEQKIILDEVDEPEEVKAESPVKAEPVKGEGTVLDSGDEDSGIESSSKATLERNKTPNVS